MLVHTSTVGVISFVSLFATLMIGPFNVASAFTSSRSNAANAKLTRKSSAIHMAPRFDPATQRWVPTTPEDEPSAGYAPIGSLLRQGPKPFINRLINPDEYDQGVLKMMASEGMDRNEAQGNMDAYLENPNDWLLQKLSEKKGGYKVVYANANMKPQKLILTAIWTCVVFAYAGLAYYSLSTGEIL